MTQPAIVVCSFYTDDEYYRAAAERLTDDLDRLGVHHVIEKLDRAPGEQWPDICRKKIPFVARVCAEYPGARVFWTDVDCAVSELPDFIREFSADFIAFQRGFGTPMTIGYQTRARFWEPSFFGINASPLGRAFIEEAARLERTVEVRATDDYFLEEAWRALAPRLSFQVIPSVLASRSGADDPGEFFTFGASGNVQEFKGQVAQHTAAGRKRKGGRRSLKRGARKAAKRVEAALPDSIARRLRVAADRSGVTDRLVTASVSTTPDRQPAITAALRAAQAGDVEGLASARAGLLTSAPLSTAELAAFGAAESFAHYAATPASAPEDADRGAEPLSLAWWARPYPGNFGDWLSPLVVRHVTDRPLRFQNPSGLVTARHLVGIGSIGRFIKPNSVVVGTGVSSPDTDLARKAQYVSLRGPLTAAVLASQGGPVVESFGDPGLLLSRILPIARESTNGRIAVVRHTTHRRAPLRLPDHADELSVLMSHPRDIAAFVAELAQYDAVVTSAMHVMIACHSYGIPCALVTFEGLEDSVPGSGMKYEDYCRGAGLSSVYVPVPVPADLTRLDLFGLVSDEKVGEGKLDEITEALATGVDALAVAGVR